MNTDCRGRWDVAPRAHPNDGRVDVVEVAAAMGLRARWQARRRLPTGTHVPHPAIRTGRATERAWHFDRPLGLWVDSVGGAPYARCASPSSPTAPPFTSEESSVGRMDPGRVARQLSVG